MLMSSAIRSLTVAVGVGFLLNSTSRVTNWSCVARCLFWFFCCCVRVLFLGGLRDAEVLLAALDAVGLGVEDILMASSWDISDKDMSLSSITEAIARRVVIAQSVGLYCRRYSSKCGRASSSSDIPLSM